MNEFLKNIKSAVYKHDDSAQESVGELFWVNTKMFDLMRSQTEYDPIFETNLDIELDQKRFLSDLIIDSGKRYKCFPNQKLNLPRPIKKNFSNLIKSRSSTREFNPHGMLSMNDLSDIFFYTYGFTVYDSKSKVFKRSIPSAGGLYSLELYALCNNVEGFKRNSIIHYAAHDHSVDLLSEYPDLQMSSYFEDSNWIDDAAMVMLITGIPARMEWKYGERAWRFIQLEAGHAAQNTQLTSTALGVQSCPVVAFYDDKIGHLIGVDCLTEVVLYAIVLGKIDKGASHETQ